MYRGVLFGESTVLLTKLLICQLVVIWNVDVGFNNKLTHDRSHETQWPYSSSSSSNNVASYLIALVLYASESVLS